MWLYLLGSLTLALVIPSSAVIQEQQCADAGGICALETNCEDGTTRSGLCPRQPNNVKCCILDSGQQESTDDVAKANYIDACLRCICEKESGCQPLPCRIDVRSLSCGYFQIKLAYYKDCGMPNPEATDALDSVEDAWKRCAGDYECSVKCVKQYVTQYRNKCPNVSYCEQASRLSNGGPKGCEKKATTGYWRKVTECLNGNS